MKTACEIRKLYGLSNSAQFMSCRLIHGRLFPKGRVPKVWTEEQEQALVKYMADSASDERAMFAAGNLR